MFEFIKSLFAAKPSVALMHSQFGLLTCEDGIWSGEAQSTGRSIPFVIGGDETAPSTKLLDRLSDALSRFDEIEREALDFLIAAANGAEQATVGDFSDAAPTIRRNEFTFSSLSFLWEDPPNYFVIEFAWKGDVDGIWRVEVEDGHPKWLGRDD